MQQDEGISQRPRGASRDTAHRLPLAPGGGDGDRDGVGGGGGENIGGGLADSHGGTDSVQYISPIIARLES